ncbi:MAG: Dabb family protein [Pseudomonadota bacterium]|nr:Dabb family protein [Pseudomonadota bacterium]
MIRHMVFMKLKPSASQADVDKLFGMLAGVKDQLDGLMEVHGGPYSSPEGINRGFTHGFSMDFKDAASRDTYLPHPAHMKIAEAVGPLLDGSFEEAVVAVDYEF